MVFRKIYLLIGLRNEVRQNNNDCEGYGLEALCCGLLKELSQRFNWNTESMERMVEPGTSGHLITKSLRSVTIVRLTILPTFTLPSQQLR
jgi:hypothetical protein